MPPDIKSVLQTILDTHGAERPACQSCQRVLYAYIDAELDGQDAAVRFPEVRRHLDECSECSRAYQELRTLSQMERDDAFEQPPLEPSFDFSFLEAAPSRPSIWESVESAGRQVAQLFTEIRIRVSQERASFDRLLQPLSPQWVAVPVTRDREADTEWQAQVLPLPSPEHDLSISLIVGPASEDEAALGVEVTKVSSRQPFSRARVTVRDAERRVLASELTRQDGRVTFSHLKSGKYLLQVKHQDRVWELPLTVSLEESSDDE